LAPLLLVKTKLTIDFGGAYSIGSIFFIELEKFIKNFPFDKSIYKPRNGEPDFVINEWYIDNKLPEDFLFKMYEWMVKNPDQLELTELTDM
jgi:hypothetical protein